MNGFFQNPFQNPLQNPFQLQQKIEKLQEEISQLRVEVAAGDGKVKLVYSEANQFESLKIDPALLTPAAKNELQEMIRAAALGAIGAIREEGAKRMAALYQELGLPM
jgi:DNA-binding YbaB/EbfC family protein